MRRAVVVAMSEEKLAEVAPYLPEDWTLVAIDPVTRATDVVAAISEACGGWPERIACVGEGAIGGDMVTAALTGWLPVDAVAAAAVFEAMPLHRRAAPVVVLTVDGDALALGERFDNVHLADTLIDAVVEVFSRLH